MIQTPFNKYRETSIQTMTPGQLLIMLYDGAIRFARKGVEGVKQKNYQEANNCFIRVQEIINELVASLDHSYPISKDLLQLYDYFLRKMVEANIKKDIQPALEVIDHLVELKETWIQASKLSTSSGSVLNHG
ncbi:flagellar export chaperone FliS [Paenibacillus sp. UNC451MF]|uniref:flagellar export chaperone FliS n=1 Tax=Paenibacillus sp. UNC451MF TaxID=1449063 RepID=UPI00048D4F2C|nr:flagellar export chaperone FliS [Paenibacillus sp. UNC451MF]